MILEATAYLDNGFRSHGVGREPTGVVAEFLEPHIQDQESQAYLLCSWSRRHPPKLPDSVAADDASPGDRRSARRRPAVETMEIVFLERLSPYGWAPPPWFKSSIWWGCPPAHHGECRDSE